MRNRSSRPVLALSLLLLAATSLAACGKKKAPVSPVTAQTVAPAPSAVAVAPASARDLDAADKTESPLDGDLAAAMQHAYAKGLLGDVYFDFDEAALRADARDRLAKNAEFLRSRPEFEIAIEGHCDERGTSEYNLALGERRAQAARDYLISMGVAANRMRSISYGEERPTCRESTEGCWQLNRRAHFVLVGRTGRG